MDSTTRVTSLMLLTLIGAASAAAEIAPQDGTGALARSTRSAEGFRADRAPDSLRDSMLLDDGDAPKIRIPRTLKPGSQATASFESSDAWVYEASIELFDDRDRDGYYPYLRVRFDADSYFDIHYVYARLYLSDDGEYWEEYHVTRDFEINGSSPDDDFEVETELVAGFPGDLYDVLIELYDADHGEFLAEYGPADSSDFSLLPLEDLGRDTPPPPVVVVSEGGGGSMDLVALALLGGLLVLRGRARRASGAVA